MRKTAQSTNPCDADMGTVTFAVCAGALLFFCLCSFLSRRYRNEQYTNNWANSQMRAPLRQEEALRDTMIEMGHQEWECPVCHFSNLPSKVECVMCGAPKGALGERQRSTLTWKQSQQQDAVKDGAGAGDVSGGMHDSGLLAGDRAVGSYSPPVLSTGSGGSRYDVDEGNQSSTSTDAPAQPGSRPINREERQRSFVVRRINRLSQRQKGARRRKQWVRRIDGDGALRWVRTASRRRGSSAGDDEDSLLGSVAADAAAAVAGIHSGRAHSNDESCSPTNVVRVNDTFNDDAMLSTSPGFVSQFLEDGSVHWNEASAIELGRDGEGGAAAVDWEAVAALSFSQKWTWLLEQLALRQVDWEEGHVKLTVRRENLLADSIAQFNVLPQPHLHRWLRIAFEDEPAIDAGGLEREWFQLCVEGLFAADFGLFSSTHATEAVSYVINPGSPASATARPTPEDHLQWFRFTGRLMGKAIMEQQIIAAHLALPLLKQILGVPITLSDLEFVDAQLHRNLLWMRENTGAEMLCLCFSVTQEEGGQIVEHELIPGGADKEVTDENKDEYISEMLKYRMLTSVSKQLHSFLQGLFEVVPRELLSVFDYQELELLLCGLPDINVQQWSHYTKYEGEFEDQGGGHPVCQWFWQVVTDFSQEDRARLLQFATGTSRVPAQGFRVRFRLIF